MKSLISRIKTAINKKHPLYWHTRQIMKIDIGSMNLGGKLKVRLDGSRHKVEIDFAEIIIVSKRKIKKLSELQRKRKQCLHNLKRQKRQINPRVRPDFWEQAHRDYTVEIRKLLKQ